MSLVFKTIQTEGIAELSYLVGDDEALKSAASFLVWRNESVFRTGTAGKRQFGLSSRDHAVCHGLRTFEPATVRPGCEPSFREGDAGRPNHHLQWSTVAAVHSRQGPRRGDPAA